jgi:fido (protein-threonine AMPylation protein)/ribosomal protein S25
MSNFDEYIRLGEPQKKEKAENWKTAIGLQQVDGLTPSAYLIETAKANIEGDITIEEVKERINAYYIVKPASDDKDNRTEEADKVSTKITEILSEKTFVLSPAEYISIHKRLFDGIYKFAGKIRDYNISKNEWVLGGKTVFYATADSIHDTLKYDFSQEKAFEYKDLTKLQMVEHFATFVSGLWQIHAFGEGNTRTTAVFAIKYLRALGFDVENDLFEKNAWYFRNALVRANYNDHNNKIFATNKYINMFFGNLLLGESNALINRDMHVENSTVKLNDDNAKYTLNDTVNDTVKLQGDTVNDAVFILIKENNRITANEISNKLNISIATAKRKIKSLKDTGYIKRVGSDKTGYWKVHSHI